MAGRRQGGAGFTLIEVAAALAVGAASVAALLQVFGEGGARADRAAASRLALMVAESVLAAAGAEGAPLAAGQAWTGAGQGLAWAVEVSDWPDAPVVRGIPAPLHLVVTVLPAGGGGPVLARLATLRLPPPEAAPLAR